MIAYMSDELGTFDVFVCAWDGASPVGQPIPVSSGGAGGPVWSRDGSRLYFVNPQSKLMAVTIQRQPRLTASTPEAAWDLDQLRMVTTGNGMPLFDALPGGSMVAIRKGNAEDDVTRFEVELKNRSR
jgi:hypothetical protein